DYDNFQGNDFPVDYNAYNQGLKYDIDYNKFQPYRYGNDYVPSYGDYCYNYHDTGNRTIFSNSREFSIYSRYRCSH
ncbi:hypothetical protein GW846_00685, partial [Candidatus Gracilibacteria bacterium]|nr:hypothetical protein [Candidatus Gracilibacteria bacterium]